MSDVTCTIFIEPQEGHSLPEKFYELFVDEDDEFTYDKTRPSEDFDDDAAVEYVVSNDDTLSILLNAAEPPRAWLDHLSLTYPDLIIECEYHWFSAEYFGRVVWVHGGVVLDVEENRFSRERFEYFDGDTDECDEGWYYTEFDDLDVQVAVESVKSAQESKDWVELMGALMNARYRLDFFASDNFSEETLRIAMVSFPAALQLMQALLTDENIDSTAVALEVCLDGDAQEAYEEAAYAAIDAGEEPEPPVTKDELLELIETIALESALLLSHSSHHSVECEIRGMKEVASQKASI